MSALPRGKKLSVVAVVTLCCAAASLASLPRGRSASRDDPKPGAAGGQNSATVKAQPLFADWPDPDAVIVFSGQQHGRLKPCGCAPDIQTGGLARRHAFIRQLEDKHWPLVMVDLGGLLEDHAEQHGDKYTVGPEQSEAQFRITLDALKLMNYRAVNIGVEDLAVRDGFMGVIGWLLNLEQPRGLSTNLRQQKDVAALDLVVPTLVQEVGQVKVGVCGVIGESFKNRVVDPNVTWQEPASVLAEKLPKLAEKSDVQVLLLLGYLEEARKLAEQFPDLDVIIHGSEFEEPPGRPEWVRKTMLVTVGTKGKYVGAVGVFRKGAQQLRFELVSLDKRFQETKEINKLLDEDYLQFLADKKLVERSPKLAFDPKRPELKFVGSDECKTCHPHVYAKWLSTPHSHALETIVKDKGQHVNPECVSCHTVGFAYTSGYDGTEATKHLGGNGCENCHGPASEHVRIWKDKNSDAAARKRANRTVHVEPQFADKSFCTRCHDAENDPTWDFDKRWDEVDHGAEAAEDADEWPKIRAVLGLN